MIDLTLPGAALTEVAAKSTVWLERGGQYLLGEREAQLLGAVEREGSIKEAAKALIGKPFADDQIRAAAEAAYIKARPLDNTDFVYQWRKQMARQYTLRALRDLQT